MMDKLTEFCRAIRCDTKRLLDDPEYTEGGSRERAVLIMEGRCLTCRARQYHQHLMTGGGTGGRPGA